MRKILPAALLCFSFLFPSELQIFFTNPPAKDRKILEQLCLFAGSAERTLDIAVFDLDNMEFAKALAAAKKRGVAVRIVTDRDNVKTDAEAFLLKSGIPVVSDNRRAFMHNKFAVCDRKRVWTGSYNFTDNCTFRNNNNALVISSDKIAAAYSAEFEEMFVQGVFGNKKETEFLGISGKDRYYDKVAGSDVNVFFSPDDNVQRIIVSLIDKADKSVDFMAFSFTSKEIAEALIRSMRKGVKVRGVYDDSGANGTGSQYVKLAVEGAEIRIKRGSGVMHNKVMIIDGKKVITGSYNFTKAAGDKNDENIVVIGSPVAAEIFSREFVKIFAQSSGK